MNCQAKTIFVLNNTFTCNYYNLMTLNLYTNIIIKNLY